MASLVYQKEAAALLLAVLGQNASPSVFDTVGNQIEKGQTIDWPPESPDSWYHLS